MFTFRRLGPAICLLVAGLTVASVAQAVPPLDALMRGGRIHYSGGRYDRAREQFQKALDQYGTTAEPALQSDIYLWLGLSEAQLRQFEPAAGHLVRAFEADSSSMADVRLDETSLHWAWTALLTATRENFSAGNNQPALEFALSAMKLDPEKPQIYALVANIYSALERFEDMRRTAEDLLKLNADSPEAYGLLGLYFLQRPDSLWPTREAKLARWDSSAYYYDQAIALHRTRYDDATKQLQQLLKETDSLEVAGIAWQLVTKSRAGDQAELKRYIEKDLKQPGQLPAMAQLASALFFAANNLNSSNARAGTAMLRASTETRGDTADRFRTSAELLFGAAVEFDPADFNSLFNLGIAQYEGQKDSLASTSFQRVIDGAVAPLERLGPALRDPLLALITAASAETGYAVVTEPLAAQVDSALAAAGYPGRSYGWFYFPDARTWKPFRPASASDAAGMFLSVETPAQLENVYLLLGVSQTGFGLSLVGANVNGTAAEWFNRATANLLTVTRINPANAEAWQNLVHCYRETGQPSKAEDAYKAYKKLSP